MTNQSQQIQNSTGSYRVAFIHTIKGLVSLFDDLLSKYLPNAKGYHIVDDTLIHTILKIGRPTPYVYRRVTEHVVAAEDFGVDAIQLTCSSVSEVVDVVKHSVSIPLLKIDKPMIMDAIRRFEKIVVIATAPSTLKPTMNQIQNIAREMNKTIDAEATLCGGAYDALLKGNRAEHDRIVRDYLLKVIEEFDAILLAQASITRVVDTLKSDPRYKNKILSKPILSSPKPAIQHLAKLLGGNIKI